MNKQFCAACHGAEGKGDGPAASNLKTHPSDLITLAKRHEGKFPSDYVSAILRFGPGISAHGSSNMPTWGPIFSIIEKSNEKAVQERIKRLCAYLASLQGKIASNSHSVISRQKARITSPGVFRHRLALSAMASWLYGKQVDEWIIQYGNNRNLFRFTELREVSERAIFAETGVLMPKLLFSPLWRESHFDSAP